MRNIVSRVILGFFGLGVILAAIGYILIFGFTQFEKLGNRAYLVFNSNGLSKIGANVVALDAGDRWVVFDTHLKPLAKSALKKIKSIDDKPVQLAFNSHWHPDHSGGNGVFTVEAQIVAHANVRRTLAGDHEGCGLTEPGSYRKYSAVPELELPETVVVDRQSFSVGDLTMEAVHYPAAHTDGDLVLYVPQINLVAIGDLAWQHGFPFVDIHSGGSVYGVMVALRDILENTDGSYRIIVGHGSPLTGTDLSLYLAMIEETVALVEKRIEAGDTLEEAQAAGLPKKYAEWETKLVPSGEWIRMIFESTKVIDEHTNVSEGCAGLR